MHNYFKSIKLYRFVFFFFTKRWLVAVKVDCVIGRTLSTMSRVRVLKSSLWGGLYLTTASSRGLASQVCMWIYPIKNKNKKVFKHIVRYLIFVVCKQNVLLKETKLTSMISMYSIVNLGDTLVQRKNKGDWREKTCVILCIDVKNV